MGSQKVGLNGSNLAHTSAGLQNGIYQSHQCLPGKMDSKKYLPAASVSLEDVHLPPVSPRGSPRSASESDLVYFKPLVLNWVLEYVKFCMSPIRVVCFLQPSVQFSRLVVSDSATPWIAAHQASLSITNSRSLLKLMSIEPVMPSSHIILSFPSPPAHHPSQHQGLFQWINSSHEVAKVLEFQLQHQSFQWTPRTDLL